MPTVTITGGSVCSGGEHRTVETDLGNFKVSTSEIQDMIPITASEAKSNFIVVVRHIYWSRRAAGRTHPQALADLVGQKVYL